MEYFQFFGFMIRALENIHGRFLNGEIKIFRLVFHV